MILFHLLTAFIFYSLYLKKCPRLFVSSVNYCKNCPLSQIQKEPPLNTTGVASQVPLPPSSMLNADELEKDLMRTAKPRNCQFQARYQIIYDYIQIEFQEFINSPSAASLNALSTRSVHGSEGGDRDLTEVAHSIILAEKEYHI